MGKIECVPHGDQSGCESCLLGRLPIRAVEPTVPEVCACPSAVLDGLVHVVLGIRLDDKKVPAIYIYIGKMGCDIWEEWVD
jgi:hypothetical protein